MGKPSRTNPMRRALRILASAGLLSLAAIPAHAQGTAIALQLPCAMAYDAQGNLLFAERAGHVVRRLTPQGVLTIIAGTGSQGFSGDGGPATSAELDSPCGVVADSSGNIFIADTRNHRVREVVAATGLIATVAGTGSPGFSGDGGQATVAQLNAPTALAIDSAGNLYIADTRNHRIRRVGATSQAIHTVAGSSIQGFSGDGGPATAAALDAPSGLALDGAGNLLIADSHNQRIRELSVSDGTIQTIAGSGPTGPGLPGFGGDGAAAASATLALPHGLSVDSAGNIYIADTANHRVRRIDGATGTISTVAGSGTEGFAGDGGSPTAASLDSPQSVAVTSAGLLTVTDTANARIRQDNASTSPAVEIHTIVGLGAQLSTGGLALSGPSALTYGSGSITATLAGGSSATGSITFLENSGPSPVPLATVPLTSGSAVLNTASLSAGSHSLIAQYAGDITHNSAQSQAFTITISPLALNAELSSTTVLYGQTVPVLTGTLIGVLPQDSAHISASFTSTATTGSPAGTYPITATLNGSAAANYTIDAISDVVTIAKAPTTISIAASGSSTLTAQAVSSTTGTPTGTVTMFDGGVTLTSVPLAGGFATYTSSALSTGAHSITALYSGDSNFLSSTSAALSLGSSSSVSAGDFAFALNGASSQAVPSGSAATYSFVLTPPPGGLSSPVNLTVSGLPAGMTASFNPAYLPPTSAVTSVTLTVQTTKTANLYREIRPSGPGDIEAAELFAMPLGIVFFRRRRRRFSCGTTFPLRKVIVASASCIVFATLASGCGDRVNVGTEAQSAPTYTLTITGTATSTSGSPIQHSISVKLQIL